MALIRLRILVSQRTPKNSWSRAVSIALKLTESQVNIKEGKVDGKAETKDTESITHATPYTFTK